jgi:hypothetical protein
MLKTTDIQGEYYMNTPTEKGEWTKELGGIWFLCLLVGFFTGGVGLFFTIPIAIVCTIYAVWAEIAGKKGQPTESTHYRLYGGRIEDLDTMDIPHSGYSALERRAEYMGRGKSPSGFINGVYNDQNRPRDVPYYDGNRDWDADD